MRELRFTLYEVLGYFLPGALFFAALVILLWGIRWHCLQVDLVNQVSQRELLVVAVFIYLLGHLSQALANWMDRLLDKLLVDDGPKVVKVIFAGLKRVFLEQEMDRQRQGIQPPGILERVRKALHEYYDVDVSKLKEGALSQLCDAAVVANGAPEEREIYIYREGFYRGVWLGLGLISLALLCPLIRQWIHGDVVIEAPGCSLRPSARILAVFAFASWVCSCFMYSRYWRFRNYRIDSGFLFFLSVPKKKAS